MVSIPLVALARSEAPSWLESKELAKTIAKPLPQLSEEERKDFLALFERLASARRSIDAAEKDLVRRLSSSQAALKANAVAIAEQQNRRSAFAARVKDYNVRCDRSFRDPAEVAKCDAEASALQAEKNSLDQRSTDLAKEQADLQSGQAQFASTAQTLEQDYAAWLAEVRETFHDPLQEALARAGSTVIRLTTKSFINHVDLDSMRADERPRMERAFGTGTNWNFSENPSTPASDTKDFRLWSQVTIVATCRDDRLASWKTSLVAHRGGKEFGAFQATTAVMDELQAKPARSGKDSTSLTLSYGIKGRPNEQVLWTFRTVRARTCADIWHKVEADVSCAKGVPKVEARVTGSRFPSHRLWINEKQTPTVDQGPLSALWDCNSSAPELVR